MGEDGGPEHCVICGGPIYLWHEDVPGVCRKCLSGSLTQAEREYVERIRKAARAQRDPSGT